MCTTTVRPATAADLGAVVTLALELTRQHITYDPRRYRLEAFSQHATIDDVYWTFFSETIASQNARVLVAADDILDVVGYAFVRFEQPNFLALCGPSGWIHEIYVSQRERRLGIGRMLLDAAIDALRRLGAQEIMLSVAAQNTAAQKLFARRGFSATVYEYRLGGDA